MNYITLLYYFIFHLHQKYAHFKAVISLKINYPTQAANCLSRVLKLPLRGHHNINPRSIQLIPDPIGVDLG